MGCRLCSDLSMCPMWGGAAVMGSIPAGGPIPPSLSRPFAVEYSAALTQ